MGEVLLIPEVSLGTFLLSPSEVLGFFSVVLILQQPHLFGLNFTETECWVALKSLLPDQLFTLLNLSLL